MGVRKALKARLEKGHNVEKRDTNKRPASDRRILLKQLGRMVVGVRKVQERTKRSKGVAMRKGGRRGVCVV